MSDIQGQVDDQALEGQPGTDTQEGQVSPFYTYESQSFKDQNELTDYIKKGTMMHSDYTKKTQSLSEERRRHENEKSEWFRKQADWDDKIKLYKQADELFKANPQAFKTVQQMIRQGASGTDVQELVKKTIEETVGPKLNEFEEYQKREKAKAERDRYFGELKGKYPDFDDKPVQELYDSLMSPDANMGTLAELLYFAQKGKGINPAQAQKEVLDNLKKKEGSGIPSARGATTASDKKPKAQNMKQLTEKLLREAGD